VADLSGGDVRVLGSARVPTRGDKGAPRSLDAAAALVRRLARTAGVTVDVVAVAPLKPVRTLALALDDPDDDTGRLRVVRAGAPTAGGNGFGVGRPVAFDDVA